MAYTFLKSQGIGIGNSKVEDDKVDIACQLIKKAKEVGVGLFLPRDHAISSMTPKEFVAQIKPAIKSRQEYLNITDGPSIPEGWVGLDIGPKTVEAFRENLRGAKTIVWNGPLGLCEIEEFDKGSRTIAKFIAALSATTIIGGGDTAAAIKKFGLEDKMTHISTGGGASLEFLEGKTLPGIAALKDKI
jgi:3-phosphoglycerate kinase